MSVELDILEREAASISGELTNDQVLAIYDQLKFYNRETKRLMDLAETAMLEWIKGNGDLVVSPTVRYYAGTSKTTKCVDLPAAVAALMEATGGNFEKFCEVLSSGAIKHGAAKKVLDPNVYDLCFKVEIRDTLEEGKPDKKLMKADEAFSGARKPWTPKKITAAETGNAAGTGASGGSVDGRMETAPVVKAESLRAGDGRTTTPLSPEAPTNPHSPTRVASAAAPSNAPPSGRPKSKAGVVKCECGCALAGGICPNCGPTTAADVQGESRPAGKIDNSSQPSAPVADPIDPPAIDEADMASDEEKANMSAARPLEMIRTEFKARKQMGARVQGIVNKAFQVAGIVGLDVASEEQIRHAERVFVLRKLQAQ